MLLPLIPPSAHHTKITDSSSSSFQYGAPKILLYGPSADLMES